MANMVMYQGLLLDKDEFRCWVYGPNDTQKLANSWEEYEELVHSGAWFTTKDDVSKRVETAKNDTIEKVEIKKGGK